MARQIGSIATFVERHFGFTQVQLSELQTNYSKNRIGRSLNRKLCESTSSNQIRDDVPLVQNLVLGPDLQRLVIERP